MKVLWLAVHDTVLMVADLGSRGLVILGIAALGWAGAAALFVAWVTWPIYASLLAGGICVGWWGSWQCSEGRVLEVETVRQLKDAAVDVAMKIDEENTALLGALTSGEHPVVDVGDGAPS